MAERIISFSIPPQDKDGTYEVKKLKDHCKKNGLNFSFLVIKAISSLNKELKI